jgi:peptidyl-prolyl cis-trans isomerase B (cyclophilin B)
MGTEKRERKKANRAAKLAAEQAVAERKRRLRFIRNVVIFVIFILVLLFVLTSCGSSDSDGGSAGSTTVAADQPYQDGADDPADPATTEPAGVEPAAYGTTACPPAEGVDEPVIDIESPFEKCIDESKTYTATFDTTEGTVVVELNAKELPVTTNNFVALARSGYYEGTDLFRIIPSAGIIQGGSPHTQSNIDPGPSATYAIPDEGPLATEADYGPGILAMARTQAPNSASAQFFFLANDGGRSLGTPGAPGAGTYRVFGQTTEGLDVLEKMLAYGTDTNEGTVTGKVTINSVTITES